MNLEEMDSIWTNLQKSDTLESLGEMIAALQERMDKKKKESIVKEKFGEFQTVKKKKQNKEVTYFRAYYYEDGKRKDKTASSAESLVEKLWAMLEENHINQNATIEEVFEQYKVSRKQICENGSIESQTRDYDTSNWKRFFEGTDFSKMRIREVKALHIRREYERICGDHKLDQKAFSKAKCLLNGIFDEAVLMGIVDVNLARAVPTKGLKFKLKEIKDGEESEQEVYTKEEMDTLRAYLDTLSEDTYTLAVKLASYFCMRIGELRALTWEDYHPEKNQIFVWHEITQGEKGSTKRSDRDVPHTKGGKESGRRWVFVPREAAKILEKLRAINGKKKYILHASKNANFSISENHFNEHLKKYCEACGVRYRPSHNFRFYGISALYEAGAAERDIQYAAGHSSVNTTRHYDRSKTSGPSLEMIEKAMR